MPLIKSIGINCDSIAASGANLDAGSALVEFAYDLLGVLSQSFGVNDDMEGRQHVTFNANYLSSILLHFFRNPEKDGRRERKGGAKYAKKILLFFESPLVART